MRITHSPPQSGTSGMKAASLNFPYLGDLVIDRRSEFHIQRPLPDYRHKCQLAGRVVSFEAWIEGCGEEGCPRDRQASKRPPDKNAHYAAGDETAVRGVLQRLAAGDEAAGLDRQGGDEQGARPQHAVSRRIETHRAAPEGKFFSGGVQLHHLWILLLRRELDLLTSALAGSSRSAKTSTRCSGCVANSSSGGSRDNSLPTIAELACKLHYAAMVSNA